MAEESDKVGIDINVREIVDILATATSTDISRA